MLSRILGAGLIFSLLANASLGVLYRNALLAQGEVRAQAQAEAAVVANERLAQSLSHQAQSHQAQVDELLRRLELSDQVTQEARERADAAAQSLSDYQPDQSKWGDTVIPDSVTERLRALL